MDGVEDVVPPFTDVAFEIRSFALLGGRSSFTALAPKESQSFDGIGDESAFCDFFRLVLLLSLPSTSREPTDGSDGKIGSDVGCEEFSPINIVPDCISCCWLLTDDFSISASRSMIRSPIPTSHSLSSYSKLESLWISLVVDVDEVDVFGSVDS